MIIDIKELYKIEEKECEALYQMYLQAFAQYPKLKFVFPEDEKRLHAVEMVLRFYGAYDFKYGVGYSLDDKLNEAVMMMHSDYMGYADELIEKAGCFNEGFEEAASHLTEEEQKIWWGFFDELDRLEVELELPEPYLYLDMVAVRPGCQGQGRGSTIIRKICDYATEQKLPVMLFTNGERDIEFYQKNGFRIIGVTKSETYGFENTYMWYDYEDR